MWSASFSNPEVSFSRHLLGIGLGIFVAVVMWNLDLSNLANISTVLLVADIIIGSHPHVVQDCDTIVTAGGRKVPVIYSLGNIISNMSAPDTQLGLMLTVRVAIHPDGATEILRPEYRFTWCSLPGRLTDSHKTVFVRDYIGRQDAWQSSYEWLKMKRTYFRVRRETGIEDME